MCSQLKSYSWNFTSSELKIWTYSNFQLIQFYLSLVLCFKNCILITLLRKPVAITILTVKRTNGLLCHKMSLNFASIDLVVLIYVFLKNSIQGSSSFPNNDSFKEKYSEVKSRSFIIIWTRMHNFKFKLGELVPNLTQIVPLL